MRSSKPAPTRRAPRQQRAQGTVSAILDAVLRIVGREGVEAVTTNRLAEVAGVSIGSVYQYFPDKAAIFALLRARHADATASVIERTLVAHAEAPLDDLLRAMVEALIDAHTADPSSPVLSLLPLPSRGAGEGFEARLSGALRLALQARGERRRLSARVFTLTQMIAALSHGAMLRRGAELSLRAAREEAVAAVLAYARFGT